MAMTCGEATIRLLRDYGVDTVFGIPGVHTLDFYRALDRDGIRHIQARNEQGAGFMADGYARVSGRPGVALVISGPGVTNAATALGQAFADSVPMLLLSAEPASHTLGKGWGVLHEITDQRAVTAPLTAFSATARRPDDVPDLLARAFTVFASARPRPVHISIPIDVLAMPVMEDWRAVRLPTRPRHDPADIQSAADLLAKAERPILLVGGGAVDAGRSLAAIAERLGAPVITTGAGKGVVPDDHPLSFGGSLMRPEVQHHLRAADLVLAVGTEIAETDSYVERLDIPAPIIRIDIDPAKMNDLYPAHLAIIGDAAPAADALLEALGQSLDMGARVGAREAAARKVAEARQAIPRALLPYEARHVKLLDGLRAAVPEDGIFIGDGSQLVYTAIFSLPVPGPRQWLFPSGFLALGCALPNAIGAQLAQPERPVVALVGDGGIMFSIQELVCAAELGLGLPIILWVNDCLKQIRDDMMARQIAPVGVDGISPDFHLLARACHCDAVAPDSMEAFQQAVTVAFGAGRPTLITVREDCDWLA